MSDQINRPTQENEVAVELENQPNKIDSDNDKSISLEELTSFYEGKTKKNGEAFDDIKVLKWKDANKDGKLSLEEFTTKPKKKGKKKKKN